MTSVAVIGCGAAGITAAVTLVARGMEVTVFDRAGYPSDLLLVSVYDEAVRRGMIISSSNRADHPHSWGQRFLNPPIPARYPPMGGLALMWGGWALRPLPADLAPRSTLAAEAVARHARPHLGALADWPITMADLGEDFEEAERTLGVRTPLSDSLRTSLPWSIDQNRWAFNSLPLAESALSRFGVSSSSRIRELWPWREIERARSLGVRFRGHTVVVGLELDERTGSCRSVAYRVAGGRCCFEKFDAYVLACGSLRTVRLLMMSGLREFACPSTKHLGRYMTFHLFGPRVLVSSRDELFLPMFSRRSQFVQSSGVGDRIFLGGIVTMHMANMPTGDWSTNAVDASERVIDLRFNGEELPSTSRVALRRRRDRDGLPQIALRRTGRRWARVVHAAVTDVLVDFVANAGRSVIKRSDFNSDWMRIGDHQMGGCRMADSARFGVVDRQGRLFALRNVVIADASTFPTALPIPPTLTIVANSRRIARLLTI